MTLSFDLDLSNDNRYSTSVPNFMPVGLVLERSRDVHDSALYKCTIYLLTYLRNKGKETRAGCGAVAQTHAPKCFLPSHL